MKIVVSVEFDGKDPVAEMIRTFGVPLAAGMASSAGVTIEPAPAPIRGRPVGATDTSPRKRRSDRKNAPSATATEPVDLVENKESHFPQYDSNRVRYDLDSAKLPAAPVSAGPPAANPAAPADSAPQKTEVGKATGSAVPTAQPSAGIPTGAPASVPPLAEVQQALSFLFETKGLEIARKVLGEYGVTKVQAMKPEQYAEFIEHAKRAAA